MQVRIRPLEEKDAYTSVKWRNDKDVFKYTGTVYDQEITIESELSWIKKVMKNTNEYRCAIEVDGIYVGNIYLTDITDNDAQYHIFIGNKDCWGKGVATAASKKILQYAFNVLHLRFVYLMVHQNNYNALALYSKLGFKRKENENMVFMRMEIERMAFLMNN